MFEKKAQDLRESIARDKERVKMYRELARVFKGVDLSDISYTYCWRQGNGKLFVEFSLDAEKRDSKVMHKIAQRLGISMTKEKSWNGESLVYRGENDLYRVEVSGAVPPTCTVVEREEALSEEEIAAALANIKRTRIVREISCMAEAVSTMEPIE